MILRKIHGRIRVTLLLKKEKPPCSMAVLFSYRLALIKAASNIQMICLLSRILMEVITEAIWAIFRLIYCGSTPVCRIITSRNILIEAEGEILRYFEEKRWAEDEFSILVEDEDSFSSNQIEEFKATYQVNVGNFDVKTDKKEKSTILKCDVYIELRTSYHDFHWFLRPLGLDFLDDHFARSERELSWEGSLDTVRTTILLKFPFKISNCHAHVWPAK
jgi:hypothetical protein